MKHNCPKNCPSAKHPDRGFYRRSIKAGEIFQVAPSEVNSLVFIQLGSCQINSVTRKGYTVSEKHFVFCYCCYTYEFRALTDMEVVVAYFTNPGTICDVGSLSALFKQKRKSVKYEFCAVAFNEPLREFLQSLNRFLTDDIQCAHLHHTMMELLFGVFRFYYTPTVQMKLFYNLLGDDISFVTLVENMRPKAKNLNHLAELCGYKIGEFNIVFRKYFKDITPHVWMQEQRKEEILKDLIETDASIALISEKHSFSHQSRFVVYCKQYLGDTPTNVRSKGRKGTK